MENLKDKSIILATDLDGTFLGGDDASRAELYGFIEENRDWLGLVFVTGRDIDFIETITEKDVPRPDGVIGDVGTTVMHGKPFKPVEKVESWIDEQWPGRDHAAKTLGEAPHLRLQDVFGGRRLSFFYDDEPKAFDSAKALEDEGFDVLISDGIYFDILPRGVQKGPTLKKVIEAFDLDGSKVLVAGDTLNDRSLFETGLDGVAVANSEPRLIEAIKHLTNVHFSKEDGAAGVFDALKRKMQTIPELEALNV